MAALLIGLIPKNSFFITFNFGYFLGLCSYQLAINFQEKAIEGWEGHGQSAEDELKEAHQLLEQLKKKAFDASSNEALMEALTLAQLTEELSAKKSQQATSGNNKVD